MNDTASAERLIRALSNLQNACKEFSLASQEHCSMAPGESLWDVLTGLPPVAIALGVRDGYRIGHMAGVCDAVERATHDERPD